MSGKGSSPRPFSVKYDDFSNSWDKIFGKKEDNTGTSKNEYQDILSTEDAIAEDEAFEQLQRQNNLKK